MTPDESPQEHVFAGGLLSTDAHPWEEPAPLGFAAPGLAVTGEGNSDAAAAYPDERGGWTQLIEDPSSSNKET